MLVLINMETRKNLKSSGLKVPNGLKSALSNPLIVFFVAFCLGLSTGFVLSRLDSSDTVPADFYVCTYSAVDPQSELLKGVFCWEGNGSVIDACPFDIYTEYTGRIYVNPEEVDSVNSANSRYPNNTKAPWN